jgi:hypothetical protein
MTNVQEHSLPTIEKPREAEYPAYADIYID